MLYVWGMKSPASESMLFQRRSKRKAEIPGCLAGKNGWAIPNWKKLLTDSDAKLFMYLLY